MKLLIKNRHQDNAGGGRHAFQIAEIATDFYDVDFDASYIDSELTGYRQRAFHRPSAGEPDIFMAFDHHSATPPEGKINIHFCYFPGYGSAYQDYDVAIANSDYTKIHVEALWKKTCFVVNPYVDIQDYAADHKEDLMLSVGSYFLEADGHSKNQDLVIDWFIKQGLYEKYKLIMTGFVVNKPFFDRLQAMAAPYPNITVLAAISNEQLRRLYSRSAFLISATGYGRDNPAQTEHFGYIAVEAMAAGCQPLVHDSGGCRDIAAVRIWNEFADLEDLLGPVAVSELRRCSMGYTRENSLTQFAAVADHVQSLLPR